MSAKYIIKFKSDASPSDVEAFYADLEKQGGKVHKKEHASKFMPRAEATLPESFARSLSGSGHDVVEYIEPDGEISVNPLPGNLPN